MAKKPGTGAKFYINGNKVGRTKNISCDYDPGLLDTPEHGDTWNDVSGGLKKWTSTIDGWFDLDDAYQLEMHTAALAHTTISGDVYEDSTNYWYGNMLISAYSWSAPVEGMVEFSMGLSNSGAIARA